MLQKAPNIASTATPDSGDIDAVIILATAGLEAFLNDLERIPSLDKSGAAELVALAQILEVAEEGKAQLRLKLELAHWTLQGKSVDRGGPVYQAFAKLVSLRNDLVHYRPIRGEDPAALDNHPHVRFFLALGLVKKVGAGFGGHVTWDRVVLIPPIAQWAYSTAIKTIAFLIELMPQGSARVELQRIWIDSLPPPS